MTFLNYIIYTYIFNNIIKYMQVTKKLETIFLLTLQRLFPIISSQNITMFLALNTKPPDFSFQELANSLSGQHIRVYWFYSVPMLWGPGPWVPWTAITSTHTSHYSPQSTYNEQPTRMRRPTSYANVEVEEKEEHWMNGRRWFRFWYY